MADENVHSTEPTAEEQEKTFTQAEVDRLIQTRLDRERRKYPSEADMTAFNTWKANQQTEQDRITALTGERDTAKSDLLAAQAQVKQLKREKYILSKGLSGDDAEFIAFKAAKMVDEKTSFEAAVDSLVDSRKKTTFDWTGSVGGGEKKTDQNSKMNALIRGAFK